MDRIEHAATMAAGMMKDGVAPRDAILTAARTWNVPYSEVARAAGHRGGKRTGKARRQSADERDAFDFLVKSK